jgi:hypothetical protein
VNKGTYIKLYNKFYKNYNSYNMLPGGYHKIFIVFDQVYFPVLKITDRKADFGINEKPYKKCQATDFIFLLGSY